MFADKIFEKIIESKNIVVVISFLIFIVYFF